MSLLAIAGLIAAEEGPHRDDNGMVTTHHWLLPETYELIYGGLASLIIFAALYKFAFPAIKKSMAARTERIQKEIDGGQAAKAAAVADAERIRSAKGDIEGERARLLADADGQAEAMLADGRTRLVAEVAELEAQADADIAAMSGRAGAELQAEISRLAAGATDSLIASELDAATQNNLVEAFIAKVGAGR
jgi:F-type H+-transporting ATPase subunit b